jgi:hypothetical protein
MIIMIMYEVIILVVMGMMIVLVVMCMETPSSTVIAYKCHVLGLCEVNNSDVAYGSRTVSLKSSR